MTRFDGIQTPYVYFGSPLSSFPYHLEDGNLCAINYLHEGQPKMWYFIGGEEGKKLENLVQKLWPEYCTLLIRHKVALIPPSVLHANGIKFSRLIQHPGDFVVSFYDAYHSGFNFGYNIAESMNFSTPDWPEICISYRECSCK